MLPKNSTNFVRKAPVALMITAVLGLAYQVRADVIEVIASTEDTNLIDGSGLNVPDGLGDSTGDTAFTSLTTGEIHRGRVGKAGTGIRNSFQMGSF